MNRTALSCLSAVLVAACLAPTPSAANPSARDIEMSPTRKKLEGSRDRSGGNKTVEEAEVAYNVKVTARSFSEITGVTIKYNIYYEVASPGSKTARVETVAGSHKIPSIDNKSPTEFDTQPFTLGKSTLDAGWYYASGAKNRTQDRVIGLWFKAFDEEGNLRGEYINPTSVLRKVEWKE